MIRYESFVLRPIVPTPDSIAAQKRTRLTVELQIFSIIRIVLIDQFRVIVDHIFHSHPVLPGMPEVAIIIVPNIMCAVPCATASANPSAVGGLLIIFNPGGSDCSGV